MLSCAALRRPGASVDRLELDDIQGLVRHGYPFFTAAEYLLVEFRDGPSAKAWLRRLRDPKDLWIDNAAKVALILGKEDCGVAIAFTDSGLRELGLGDETMHSFVGEFQEGMAAEQRARLLGDVGLNRPETWTWGGGEEKIHALLIVFAESKRLADRVREIEDMKECPIVLHRFTGNKMDHEPFGFADGISQPFVEGLTRKKPPRGVRTVKAGEFVLGYLNEFGRFPASPWVAADARAKGLARLGGSGRADFGRNGSFLVMRQLEQEVAEFGKFIKGREELAASMVGRRKSGAPLVRRYDKGSEPKSQAELERENDFTYHKEDRHGFRCPIGSHIRRANPRDSLADSAGVTPEEAQALVDRHRILRRGRVYKQGERQGLLFLCLNANIERQFEFVQGSWLMNPQFGGLQGETDPLLGYVPEGETRTMTLQHPRLAKCLPGLGRYVTVKGGAYFFVPGLKAIDYLAKP